MVEFGDTQMGEELRKLLPEYPLHFLDLSKFKHYEYFRAELRPLLELFRRRNNKEEAARYIKENENHWKMNDESWYMLSQLTNSWNLKKLVQEKEVKKKEASSVSVFDELIEDRIEEKVEERVEARIAERKVEAKAEFIVDLLEEYGIVPDDVKEIILKQTDISILKEWNKLAARTGSIDEFIAQSKIAV